MIEQVTSKVFVLGDNINTDTILTAEYMKINPATETGYKELGSLAMCGLAEGYPEFINIESGKTKYEIIVAGDNFGCGSSREHAPMALGSSGVKIILANSFARIFFRNCIATGELFALEVEERLCDKIKTDTVIEVNLEDGHVYIPELNLKIKIKPIGDLNKVITAGGIFEYGRINNII
ncbi:MAG TPA: 3-isopropylmalate dehydratase [Bacteroidia bacterium]|nr:3-isopropylmalate dehydratase [Bacteroidia bacterium]